MIVYFYQDRNSFSESTGPTTDTSLFTVPEVELFYVGEMVYSRNNPLPPCSSYKIGLFLLFQQIAYLANGLSVTHLDLGRTITRVAYKDRLDVFVGGVNFVAQLSPSLDLLFNITIGPVAESEHCDPNPAPCDNTVMVLEIDTSHNMLMVCGSAYRGTCTLHSLYSIINWYCLYPEPGSTGADVVAGSNRHPSVTHFLPAVIPSTTVLLSGDAQEIDASNKCRPSDFAREFGNLNDLAPKPARVQSSTFNNELSTRRRGRSKRSNGKEQESTYNGDTTQYVDKNVPVGMESDKLTERFQDEAGEFKSNIMVAGSLYLPQFSNNPPHLSIRQINFVEPNYTIGYARNATSKLIGFDVPNNLSESLRPEYKLSFQWKNYSYFLFLQESRDCGNNSPCIVTKMSRTCHGPSSVLPYVELTLSCGNTSHGPKYRLLSSAVLGTVGLAVDPSYMTVPVLVMAFGNGSHSLSKTTDPRYGSTVCAVTLDQLNNYEFDYALNTCASGSNFSKQVNWINGHELQCHKETLLKETCSTNTRNRYVQSTEFSELTFIAHIKDGSVVSILTHTHMTVSNSRKQSPLPRMDVFLLTNGGQFYKFSLRARQIKEVFFPDVAQTKIESFDVQEQFFSNPVGVTDHGRAVIYIASGQKITEIDLEFCPQFHTCSDCLKHNICRWCPTEKKCWEKELALSICQTGVGETCPPRLDDFSPLSVPTQGGSTLTLRGSDLGNHLEEGRVTVTVCDQPCDDVRAYYNNVTCQVKKQCPGCTKCNVTITVTGQKHSDGSASSFHVLQRPVLEYVIPTVTSFSPKYGPVSGGTRITFQGQNLKVGSSTNIRVGDGRCDVIYSTKDLICRVVEDSGRRTGPVNIKISIDLFNVTLSKETFQFRSDPRITRINPKNSIVSGGVTITVDGQHLDSVASPILQLAMPYTHTGSNSTLVSVNNSRCEVMSDGNRMKCKTPGVSQHFTGTTNVLVNVSFDMDGRDPLSQLPGPHEITVQMDPTFNLDDKPIVIRQGTTTLLIHGKKIPTWIDRSEINVTIGNISLEIIAVTNNHIECDLKNAIMEYGGLSENETENQYVESDTTVASNNRTVATDTTKSNERTTARTTRSAATTSVKSTSKTTKTPSKVPSEPFPGTVKPNVTKRIVMKNSIDLQQAPQQLLQANLSGGYNSDSETDTNASQTSNPDEPGMGTSIGSQETFSSVKIVKQRGVEYRIWIKIGNYEEDLGVAIFGNTGTAKPTTSANHDKNELPLITGASGVGVVFLILVIVSCVMYIRARRARALVKEQAFFMSSLSGSQHGSREGALPTLKQILESVIEPEKREDMDKLIITLDRLTVGKTIGSGNFGCVFEGFLSSEKEGLTQKVAIKTLQDPSSHNIDLHGFVQEAVIMRDFEHPHVLGLIGLAEKEPGIPYVILPYMDNGDLLSFVRDSSVILSLHDVIKFGADIASGMAYLSTLKFVHRDLAARNCMLDDQCRVKVADFGLCRDIYEKGYYTSDNRKKLPIRWMAMESIEQGAYSSKSDVWSFGVVLWELLSRGVTPYPGVNGWDIINFLRQRRLAPPYFCPDELYNMMMQCWAKDPNLRPEFIMIQTQLLGFIGQSPNITDTITRRRGDTIQQYKNLPKNSTPSTGDIIDSRKDQFKPKTSNTNNKTQKGLSTVQTTTSQEKSGIDSEKDHVSQHSHDKKENAYANLNCHANTGINNILIVIPTCYSHRDVSKTAAGVYIQLVDNYEPPPKFSNPLLRSMKKHSKKFSEQRNTKGLKKPDDSKTNSNGYSFPGEFPDIGASTSDLTRDLHYGRSRTSDGSLPNRDSKEKSYYELELTSMRTSATSESRSDWGTLDNTGSSVSILEVQSRESLASNGQTSGSSSLTRTHNHSLQQPSPRAAAATKNHSLQQPPPRAAVAAKKPSAAPRKLPIK